MYYAERWFACELFRGAITSVIILSVLRSDEQRARPEGLAENGQARRDTGAAVAQAMGVTAAHSLFDPIVIR